MTKIIEKRKSVLLIVILLFIFFASGCSVSYENSVQNQASDLTASDPADSDPADSDPASDQKIEENIKIRTVDPSDNPVKGVKGVMIGCDGEIIDTFETDDKGEANRKISVPVDKRYPADKEGGLSPRGTVTIISFKEGYQESVTFEAGVGGGNTVQNIVMKPLVEGQRNEPNVYLGYNHHLEILSLVEKYAKIIGEEVHQ